MRPIALALLFASLLPAQQMLAAHNALRARVGVPPLEWSVHLATYAQKWADALVAGRRFHHRPDTPYGENLYAITGASATPADVVKSWGDESHDYDHRSNACRAVCGHYTQIVWAGTRRVGCAVARGRGREVWVCNYDPPGNWNGRRPY